MYKTEFNFKLNATQTGGFQLDVLFNTTLAGVTKNSTSGVNITIKDSPITNSINVNKSNPTLGEAVLHYPKWEAANLSGYIFSYNYSSLAT